AQVPLIGSAMLRNALVEVGAGGKEKSGARYDQGIVGIESWALRCAGGPAEIGTKSEESVHRVVGDEVAQSAGKREIGQDIERSLAERCVIPVDTFLFGKPDRTGKSVDGILGPQSVDQIVLLNEVRLPLVEQSRHGTQPVILRSGDAQFVAPLCEVVVIVLILRRIGDGAVVVVDPR